LIRPAQRALVVNVFKGAQTREISLPLASWAMFFNKDDEKTHFGGSKNIFWRRTSLCLLCSIIFPSFHFWRKPLEPHGLSMCLGHVLIITTTYFPPHHPTGHQLCQRANLTMFVSFFLEKNILGFKDETLALKKDKTVEGVCLI
jgi:hypothetical protein